MGVAEAARGKNEQQETSDSPQGQTLWRACPRGQCKQENNPVFRLLQEE